MNSSAVSSNNGILQEELQEERAASSSITNSDSNANVNDGIDRSKGAIPKIKSASKSMSASQRKAIKLNNNVEEIHSLNGVDCGRDSKRNGFDKERRETQIPVVSFASVYEEREICENIAIDDKSRFDFQTPQVDYDVSLNFNSLCLKKDDSENSSDDTELLSISDDGCIYTYKGDNVADLPDSFFSLDIPILENENIADAQQRNSSPEMDFLEMDFDPGPTGDIDSDSISNSELEQVRVADRENDEITVNGAECVLNNPKQSECEIQSSSLPVTSNIRINEKIENIKSKETATKPRTVEDVKMPWSCVLSQRTTGLSCLRSIRRQHNSCGELVSPVEPVSPLTEQSCSICSSPQRTMPTVKRTMIWSDEEAANGQVVQIGASACGATAVLNVLKALRFPLPTKEKVQEAVQTKLRANSSPFVEYLLSRSSAGTTHEDLISGLHKLSDGKIYARFFSTYPERVVNLNMWLSFWIENGAVPIATLNLQKGIQPIPDAWHHQMIYGVSEDGIHLTNPLECVSAEDLWPQLCSESVLLIKREDVLSRWNREEFVKLMKVKDPGWRRLNVVGRRILMNFKY